MQKIVMINFPIEDLQTVITDCVNACLKHSQPTIPTTEVQPDLIKIKEAESETGFKKGYIYELVSKKAIPFHKCGHSLRFSRTELKDWIRAGRPSILQQAVENMASEHIVKRKEV